MKRARSLLLLSLIVAASGCSALFEMSTYDEGSAESIGSADGGGGPKSNVADGGSDSTRPSSGGPDGQSPTPIDAASDVKAPCKREVEPNDLEGQANALAAGETCGTLANTSDEDYFVFTTTKTTDFTIELTSSLRAQLLETTNGSVNSNWSGGGSTKTLGPGTYELHVDFFSGGAELDYKITLAQ